MWEVSTIEVQSKAWHAKHNYHPIEFTDDDEEVRDEQNLRQVNPNGLLELVAPNLSHLIKRSN